MNYRSMNSLAIKQLKENWSWYLLLGIALVILGILAIIFSVTSTLISIIYLGVFFVIFGIFEAAQALKTSKWSNFFLHLFLSILYIVGGIFMITNPHLNAVSLTLVMAIFFVISGIFRIVYALASDIPHKGWLVFNGIVTVILGGMIWYEWPYSGLWVIGTLVGVDAIFTGWTWIMLSIAAKKLTRTNISGD